MCELYLNKKGDIYVLIGNNLQDTIVTWKKTFICNVFICTKVNTHTHSIHMHVYIYLLI